MKNCRKHEKRGKIEEREKRKNHIKWEDSETAKNAEN